MVVDFRINLDGEEFPEHLQPFLNTRTSHFLHELVSFARSPLSMAAYDHSVRYEWPTGGGRARDTWDPEATVNHTFPPQQLTHSPEGIVYNTRTTKSSSEQSVLGSNPT